MGVICVSVAHDIGDTVEIVDNTPDENGCYTGWHLGVVREIQIFWREPEAVISYVLQTANGKESRIPEHVRPVCG